MSIKKSPLALAMAAIAAMAFAAPAMATDGVLRDVSGTTVIANGTEIHTIGSIKFGTAAGSYECHVTSVVKATGAAGTTGEVTKLEPITPAKCTGTGLLNGCVLKAHKTENLPYAVTITNDGRIHFKGTISFHIEWSSCLATTAKLTFSDGTLTPLKTGTRVVTGTEGRLGATAALNEPMAGFEVDSTLGPIDPVTGLPEGTGVAHIKPVIGAEKTEQTTVSGEFEITGTNRCTYEISAT